MKIEVLFFPGCPHRWRAVEEVEQALAAERMQANVIEIEVSNEEEAELHAFYGSPTIRVNGRDVDPTSSSANFGVRQCRLYPGGEFAGVPPRDLLQSALREAAEAERH